MAWTTKLYSKGAIDRAGAALVAAGHSAELGNDLLGVINNWRACHAYPLHAIKMTLRKRAKSINSKALIAQRLKRLPVVRQIVVHHTKRISFSLGRFFGLGSHADSSIRENARRERGLSWPGFKKEFGSQKNSSRDLRGH
jgi:hypothetical protein